MLDKVMEFFKDMFYENGKPSRTGIIAFIIVCLPLLVWCGITIAAYVQGKAFAHYDTMSACVFGTSAGGGGLAVVNKWINSALNSVKGCFPDKGTVTQCPTPDQTEAK